MICYSLKMHVKLFISRINKKLHPKFKNNNQINVFFSFKMLYPNLLTIQSIKNKKLVK